MIIHTWKIVHRKGMMIACLGENVVADKTCWRKTAISSRAYWRPQMTGQALDIEGEKELVHCLRRVLCACRAL